MGYRYSLSGELVFEPPLPYKAFRDSYLYAEHDSHDPSEVMLYFAVDEDMAETDTGTVFTITASAVIAAEDEFRIDRLEDQLNEAFGLIPSGTAVTGWIEAQGEDSTSWFRIYPKRDRRDGKIGWTKVYAELHWPLVAAEVGDDDETVELSRG